MNWMELPKKVLILFSFTSVQLVEEIFPLNPVLKELETNINSIQGLMLVFFFII